MNEENYVLNSRTKQILRDIKLAELLGYKLKGLNRRVKDYIDNSLTDLVTFGSDKYPNSIFFKRYSIIMFEIDLLRNELNCNKEYYTTPFISMGLTYQEAGELTEKLVRRNLRCENFEVYLNSPNILKLMNE